MSLISESLRRQARGASLQQLDESAELVADSRPLSEASLQQELKERKRDESADLCYLTNGGSSLTLAVNEATPVGALIGTLEVSLPASKRGRGCFVFVGRNLQSGGRRANCARPRTRARPLARPVAASSCCCCQAAFASPPKRRVIHLRALRAT